MATKKKKDPILEVPEDELGLNDLVAFGLKLRLVDADSDFNDGSEKLQLVFRDQKRRKWQVTLEAERGSDIWQRTKRLK